MTDELGPQKTVPKHQYDPSCPYCRAICGPLSPGYNISHPFSQPLRPVKCYPSHWYIRHYTITGGTDVPQVKVPRARATH